MSSRKKEVNKKGDQEEVYEDKEKVMEIEKREKDRKRKRRKWSKMRQRRTKEWDKATEKGKETKKERDKNWR